ncbi:MAG: tetratricopeptide repeat protein [bacterium]
MRNTALVYMAFVCALLWAASSPLFATKADGMVSTIESHMQAKNYEAAAKAAAELTEHYPEFLKGWMLLGYCLSVTGDYSGSNRAYAKALTLGGEPDNLNKRMAYNYLRLGKYDDAKKCYQTILETDPDNIEALKQLGNIEAKLGNLNQAAQYYERTLELNANDTEVILALAKVESKRGGNGSVKALIEEGLKLDPDNTAFLGKLGLIQIKEKNFQGAVEPLSKLVSLEPDNVTAHRNLGVAYYQLGEKKAAKDQFETVKRLGGDMDDLYGPLADCYMAAGQDGEALSVIQAGIDRDIQKAWLYSLWGKILERQKNYDGAITMFAKAVDLKEDPWSDYARKQIARQSKLKKREQMMARQQGTP